MSGPGSTSDAELRRANTAGAGAGAAREHDVLVLGSGIAGLSAAIHAANAGLSVLVLTKGRLEQSATRYAQGGVAAALAAPDSPELHLSDTLTAGAGLCDVDAVRILVGEGPRRVRELIELGAVFDRTGDGEAAALALAREGGHSLPRVVHAGGDATGAEIERALVAAAAASGADVRERWFTTALCRDADRCTGVLARSPDGDEHRIGARHTILATGGAGQLYSVTTNPALSTGDGMAMARRAGALLADMEFMQFHPTALHQESMPRPLLSEALRGEGAVLRDEHGVAFMRDEHELADLAPRDVVSRAIMRRLRERRLDHLWLDATTIDDFPRRFPTIWRACRDAGLDPRRDWLPVAPAAHYLSGGVATDLDGATTLPGLWACGEVACSGVHGANRLASNSLLDGLVFAPRVVDAIVRGKARADVTGVLRGLLDADLDDESPSVGKLHDAGDAATIRDRLQRSMTDDAGVLRDAETLVAAQDALLEADGARQAVTDGRVAEALEVANLCTVGRALVSAAAARHESRGTHTRLDFTERSPDCVGRFVLGPGDRPTFVPLRNPAGDR